MTIMAFPGHAGRLWPLAPLALAPSHRIGRTRE
jgi:hypothetical protein